MKTPEPSPKILALEWGKIDIEHLGTGKDFKLWPGGGRAWDWRETGTQHHPGIQISDVEELLHKGCQIIILTKGRLHRLKIPTATINFLKDKGIEVIVAETKKGVTLYNKYVEEGSPVGGLFHSTC